MPGRSHRRIKHKTAGFPGPIAFARAYRRRRVLALTAVALLICAAAIVDHVFGLLPVDDDWHRYHGRSFEVVRVIDGDTLVLREPDGDSAVTTVRLWGVDCPDLADTQHNRPAEPGAEQAAQFTRSLVDGRAVELRLQRHRVRDRSGRVLAYVVLPDGRELNAALLEAGLAACDEGQSHDRGLDYAALARQAKEQGVGIWSD